MRKKMMESVDIFKDNDELAAEVEEKAKEIEKEVKDEIEEAEEIVDDINYPEDTETPKTVEIKPLKEQLILNEDLEDFNDLVDRLVVSAENILWDYSKWVSTEEMEDACIEACHRITEEIIPSIEHEMVDTNESLNEDLKVISSLSEFEPWGPAINTLDKVEDAGMLDELDALLDELYPEGLLRVQLNDILWEESDWILSTLGIQDSEDEGDEESEELEFDDDLDKEWEED